MKCAAQRIQPWRFNALAQSLTELLHSVYKCWLCVLYQLIPLLMLDSSTLCMQALKACGQPQLADRMARTLGSGMGLELRENNSTIPARGDGGAGR
jgi:hypothetical protein